MMKLNHRIGLALATIFLVAACSSTKQTSDFSVSQGFLPQPTLLKPGESGQLAKVYFNPGVTMGTYNKVILDPVSIWTTPGSQFDQVPAEQRRAFADDFHAHLYDKISQHCQMVNIPTPGALRIRVALVDATQSDPALNTLATYEPHVKLLTKLASYTFNDGVSLFAGEATAESYATDATGGPDNGRLLWEGADERAGSSAIGTNTLNSWEDVYDAIDAWSEKFAQGLVKHGVCH
jgi:hypothetical protein